MKTFRELRKQLNEYYDEYDMIRRELDVSMNAIERISKHVQGQGQLESWVQSKLTRAADYLDSVADYMDSNMNESVNEGAAWTKKSGQNKEGGLNEKGRKSYERENPGSDLKRPSKDKDNPRRKSFCARMKGMKKKETSKKTANDPDSRINKSLRAWNC
jgi:hypothetical protein